MVHSRCTDLTQATARLIRAKYEHNKSQNKTEITWEMADSFIKSL